MQEPHPSQANFSHWICPDLRSYWQINKLSDSNQFLLQALTGNQRFLLTTAEAYALGYFNGQLTTSQIQKLCRQTLGNTISPEFVVQLLQKLIALNILALPEEIIEASKLKNTSQTSEQFPDLIQTSSTNTVCRVPTTQNSSPVIPSLKPCVQWIHHPNGYWILRNPEDVTYLQVDERSKAVIEDLGQQQPNVVLLKHNIIPTELRSLLQLLAISAMLEGTKLPKTPKRKFSPTSLLFFKLRLFNPDSLLTQNVYWLHWIWTKSFTLLISFLLAFSTVIGLHQRSEIILTGQQLFARHGSSLMIPFCLLTILVVTLHEFGHAFTLKHYGGIVPEVGLLFMFLIPAAYTNTTDAYCLVKRRQRVLVVAAGVICQLIIAAFALWLINLSVPGSWLATTSYLLLVAALFTIALNLNPLAKFDGYYLAVALSGINNLRSRSFSLYANLLRGKLIQETPQDALILAAYAPFSFAYVLSVFGFLFYRVTDWSLSNIPTLAFTLLTLWAIYFYFPTKNSS